MAISWPNPGFKMNTCGFWILDRGDLNFCVRSIPLREVLTRNGGKKDLAWAELTGRNTLSLPYATVHEL